MVSGIAASRVRKPKIISAPQTISTTPTKGPVISGNGIPILAKRPAPRMLGYTSFWIPSGKKTTTPTSSPDHERPARRVCPQDGTPTDHATILTDLLPTRERLEQLDRIAGRVVYQNVLATIADYDLAAEAPTGGLQLLHSGRQLSTSI